MAGRRDTRRSTAAANTLSTCSPRLSSRLRRRSDLVDAVILRLYRELLCSDLEAPEGLCLVALGGYGRRELFPYSDIDLLFLTKHGRTEGAQREAIAAVSRALWDLGLRVG